MELLDKYSDFWKLDSVGKNGFRELLTKKFLSKCTFIGTIWNSVSGYFGKSNDFEKLENNFYYVYRLNYFNENIYEIGSLLLKIKVNKGGIIISFDIKEIDG